MKVILDANIWFSYLLTPTDVGTIPLIVRHCAHKKIDVLIPDELAQEIRHTVVNRPYLSARIPYKDVETYLGLLREFATLPPSIMQELARFDRGPDDDYLIAYALVHECDYLVTGDQDLLALRQVRGVQIVGPVAFLEIVYS